MNSLLQASQGQSLLPPTVSNSKQIDPLLHITHTMEHTSHTHHGTYISHTLWNIHLTHMDQVPKKTSCKYFCCYFSAFIKSLQFSRLATPLIVRDPVKEVEQDSLPKLVL